MNIWGMAALAGLGGVVVNAADKRLDKYAYNWKVSETRTVKIRPGTMAAGALVFLLALLPGSNATGMRAALAALGVGALAAEGLELYDEHAASSVDKMLAPSGAGAVGRLGQGTRPTGVPQQPAYSHVGHGGRFAGDLALQQAALRWGRRRAA